MIDPMEFTLDVRLIRDILSRDYARAANELRTLGVFAALANSRQVHEQRIADAPDVSSLACKSGCAWCCYFTVDVRPVEVFAILDFVEQSFATEEKSRVYAQVHANSVVFENLGADERGSRNVKCPFLSDGRCGIYVVRPHSCRNYHATNAAGCQQSYEQPDDLEIDPEFAPGVYQAGAAYELNQALAAALAQPSARERFQLKLKPFAVLEGEPVIAEFDDLGPHAK
jgi:Fe-S-cluster containining protein